MKDEEINRAIAEELGYSIIEPPEEDGTRGFRLCGPAGQNIRYGWHETESEAWAGLLNFSSESTKQQNQ